MFGLSAGTAALYISFYSIANSSGRLSGDHSDKIGRSKTLLIIYSVIVPGFILPNYRPGQLGFTLELWTWYLLWRCMGSSIIVMENYGPAITLGQLHRYLTGYSLLGIFQLPKSLFKWQWLIMEIIV